MSSNDWCDKLITTSYWKKNALLILVVFNAVLFSESFIFKPPQIQFTPNVKLLVREHHYQLFKNLRNKYSVLEMARYGPKEVMPTDMEGDFFEDYDKWESEDAVRITEQDKEFKNLVDSLVATENPDHLPGIMARNIDLLLSMRGFEGVRLMKEAIKEAEESGDENQIESVSVAVDYIISFIEEFVDQAKSIDDGNKQLLGKIIRSMAKDGTVDNNDRRTAREREESLDLILQQEKENFSPGFLRHLEGECQRIASAPITSPKSAKLLETLKLIQTRVVEELGKDLGEGAEVLGQLLGYDDLTERLAVLDAGLTVRGVDFAGELSSLTGEALDGFEKLGGNVDPELVRMISEIHDRIQSFIVRSTKASV